MQAITNWPTKQTKISWRPTGGGGSEPGTSGKYTRTASSRSSVNTPTVVFAAFQPVVSDRKKDLVKLQAGEYVSLGKVEAQLKTCPLIDNICVYGDSTKQFCVALVVANQQQLKDLAIKKGIGDLSFEDLCQSPDVERVVIAELNEHGKKSKLIV